MLLAEEFAAVPAAKEALARLFPDADIDAMVEEQPLLLVEDIELAVSELKRCANILKRCARKPAHKYSRAQSAHHIELQKTEPRSVVITLHCYCDTPLEHDRLRV